MDFVLEDQSQEEDQILPSWEVDEKDNQVVHRVPCEEETLGVGLP